MVSQRCRHSTERRADDSGSSQAEDDSTPVLLLLSLVAGPTEATKNSPCYKVFRIPKTLFIQGVFFCTGSLLVGAIPPTNSVPVQ